MGRFMDANCVSEVRPALSRGHLDAISGPCALLSEDGVILETNSAWDAFAVENGYQGHERQSGFGKGLNYLRICEQADGEWSDEAEFVGRGLKSVLNGQVEEFAEEYPCHSPAQKRWFKLFARRVPTSDHRFHQTIIQHVDVTDQVTHRLTTERARLDLADQLQTLIEMAPIRIAVLDRDLRYRFANSAFCDGVGHSLDALVGRSVRDILDKDTFAELLPHMGKALAGRPSSKEISARLTNGRPIDALVTYLPDHGERDKVTGLYAIVQDITELKKRESELIQAKIQADQANQAKSEFLACMSHDLRTPLNAVIGFSELILALKDRPAGDRDVLNYVDLIHMSGSNLLAMIDKLLDLSAIESGRYTLNREQTDINTVLRDSANLVLPMAEKKGLSLHIDIPKRRSTCLADEQALRQVFVNLITNAVKFTEEGTVHCSVKSENGFVRVLIKDTGVGISQDVIDLLEAEPHTAYRALQRKNLRTDPKQPGWGLGLSICRNLIKLHGGTISVEGRRGQGTTVAISLPKA